MIKINQKDMSGLTVQGGRLINNRPDGVTGIQQVARMRKELKREEKISMMEEAMFRAEVRADMHTSIMGKYREI